MSDERNAADRVRPFLQRMEQSILAARHRRLHGTDEPVPVAPPQQVPPAAPPSEPVVGPDLERSFAAAPCRDGR